MTVKTIARTFHGMPLNKAEMQAYTKRVAEMLAWMIRARRRLEKRQETGEIYQATVEAENALHSLRIKTHYASCDGVAVVNVRE